jgi:2-acylglycerol O-acyltransferase 2
MSLNPEPAAPEERAQHHLPPKSYADAAEEALQKPAAQSHANGTDGANEHAGTDGTIEKNMEKKAGTWLRYKNNEVKANGISTSSHDDKTSLEGIGQDATPRSPTVKGHRRVSSRSSHDSLGRKQGKQAQQAQSQTDVFEKHPNGNGKALTSVKPQQEFEVAKADRRTDLKRRDQELTTGRQAGAGWSKSK